MSEFERLYYESDSFWQGEMLQDEDNKLRIKFTADLIPANVKTLIDVGCGNGVFVNYLQTSRPNLDIIGMDRSATALKYVRTKKEQGDISNIQFPDKTFDCVTCLEVIEHLPVNIYEKSLEQLARIAKDYLIISVPYNERLEESYNQCPSCKTIFNYQLHLRSYSDEYFKHLFDKFGFECVSTDKLGLSKQFKGHYMFRKLFYKEQFLKWQSPICPICGYQHQASSPTPVLPQAEKASGGPSASRKLISYITWFPKLIWPKEERYYWIIGLFKRVR
jgi:SAM-dependent methyltransferase